MTKRTWGEPCRSNPEHIQEAQARWVPGDMHDPETGLAYRFYRPDEVYFVECARIVQSDWLDGEQEPGEPVYETLYIPGKPEGFEPILSPMTMMAMGIFGNAYFGSLRADTKYPLGRERHALFPPYKGSMKFQDSYHDKPVWKTAWFQKKASLSREWWLERRLISNIDPLGWFEWYCWYWLGRRHDKEDRRQIERWINYRVRQSAMLQAMPTAVGLRQALLHWSVDPWIV